MAQDQMKQVSEQDLQLIYQALKELAGGEGSLVAETLCSVAGVDDGMRIYNEVFA